MKNDTCFGPKAGTAELTKKVYIPVDR